MAINKKENKAILEMYMQDIYGLLNKKLVTFVTADKYNQELGLSVHALVQELIKIKKLLAK